MPDPNAPSGGREMCPETEHKYEEVSSPYDMEGETYRCSKCGDRYRLYYEDMK